MTYDSLTHLLLILDVEKVQLKLELFYHNNKNKQDNKVTGLYDFQHEFLYTICGPRTADQ